MLQPPPFMQMGFFRPCCVKCDEYNRSDRTRFNVVDGKLLAKTTYCSTCKECILEGINAYEQYLDKVGKQGKSADFEEDTLPYWSVSHCKRGYFSMLCPPCMDLNQNNPNRFVFNECGQLLESLSYCQDCASCCSDLTIIYREKIAAMNSKNYHDNQK
jgi:hypothetical protein